jgi:putative ABC transport system permease protein
MREDVRPDWRPELRTRLAGLAVDPARVDDIVEEMAQHLDDRYDALVASHVSATDAQRLALDELAAPHVLARAVGRVVPPPVAAPRVLGAPPRRSWGGGLREDVRDGLRALRSNPALTLVALLTLGVGIGANAAIFSVVNAAILRPLPFADPDRLVSFWGSAPKMGIPVVNYPDALYVYIRTRGRDLSPIAAYGAFTTTLTEGSAEPERLASAGVTANFFDVLGRAPMMGRAFLAEEERQNANHVTIVSHRLWQRRFAGDPQLVGKALMLDGTAMTVVGIMPPGFDFPQRADLWTPLPTDPQSLGCWCYDAIGRLAPGRTPADGAREMAWLNDAFWREREGKPARDPDAKDPRSVIIAQPLARTLVGDVREPLLILLGAVAMVLLIACANIANLLLARASARGREIALRCCLGASPLRIVRQLLVESLLLGVAGAAIGLVFAWQGARVLGRIAIERLTYVDAVTLDPTVLVFTLVVTLITVVLFGVAPALRAARVDLQEAVRDGWRSTRTAASRRLADAFVVAQFALSIVLLVAGGLLLRSLANLRAVDPGFRSENVLVGRIALPWLNRPALENENHARLFFEQLTERVRSVPGVRNVGFSSSAPFSQGNRGRLFTIRGREPAKGEPNLVTEVRSVTPDYFAAVGTTLRRGRVFDDRDTQTSPPVVIVDETLARRFWPDGNALGHLLRLGDDADSPWRTIVGVVASVKHGDLSADSDRYVYSPHRQAAGSQMDLVVRTAADPAALTATIRREIRALDASLPFFEVHTLEEAVEKSVGTRRLTTRLLLAFAIAALLLAAVGIYGVMALGVSQRVHELAIRLALGASRVDVLTLVLRRGMALVLVGAAIGLAGAMTLTHYLETLLFRVAPIDPVIFTAVTLGLIGVALAACLIPARRATTVAPLEALRQG